MAAQKTARGKLEFALLPAHQRQPPGTQSLRRPGQRPGGVTGDRPANGGGAMVLQRPAPQFPHGLGVFEFELWPPVCPLVGPGGEHRPRFATWPLRSHGGFLMTFGRN